MQMYDVISSAPGMLPVEHEQNPGKRMIKVDQTPRARKATA